MAWERDPWTVGCRYLKLILLVAHESPLPPSLVPLVVHGSPLPPSMVLLEAHGFPSLPRLVLVEAHGPSSLPICVQHTILIFRYPNESGTILAFCFGT